MTPPVSSAKPCEVCGEPYSMPPTARAGVCSSVCSSGFHCCRDCVWKNGEVVTRCWRTEAQHCPSAKPSASPERMSPDVYDSDVLTLDYEIQWLGRAITEAWGRIKAEAKRAREREVVTHAANVALVQANAAAEARVLELEESREDLDRELARLYHIEATASDARFAAEARVRALEEALGWTLEQRQCASTNEFESECRGCANARALLQAGAAPEPEPEK